MATHPTRVPKGRSPPQNAPRLVRTRATLCRFGPLSGTRGPVAAMSTPCIWARLAAKGTIPRAQQPRPPELRRYRPFPPPCNTLVTKTLLSPVQRYAATASTPSYRAFTSPSFLVHEEMLYNYRAGDGAWVDRLPSPWLEPTSGLGLRQLRHRQRHNVMLLASKSGAGFRSSIRTETHSTRVLVNT